MAGKPLIIAWHQASHHRFGEQLCFFLIAVHRYNRDQLVSEITSVLKEHEIGEYCFYQVLGQFDCLLRVWLPFGEPQFQFSQDLTKSISWFQDMMPFKADQIPHDWRFPEAPTERALIDLDENDVRRVQSGEASEEKLVELEEKSILVRMPASDGKKPKRGSKELFKAFITVRPPDVAYGLREKVAEQLIQAVTNKSSKALKDITIHHSIGGGGDFAWILIKLTTDSIYALGSLSTSVSELLGVATQTYVVIDDNWVEGEEIGGLALRASERRNPKIAEFLPSLYEDSELSNEEIASFESYIINTIFSGSFRDRELKGVSLFLEMCIDLDQFGAFGALYPLVAESEKFFREMVLRHANANFEGGLKALVRKVNESSNTRQPIKSANKMSLGDALLALNYMFIDSHDGRSPEEPACLEQSIQNIAKLRNIMMHGGEFDSRKDWQDALNQVFALSRARDYYSEIFK